MLWNRDPRYRVGGWWKCAVKHRAQQRGYYDRKSGVEFNRLLLRMRRNKALARRRERKEQHG